MSEEPSLWRDYEGRENARDRGVLARSNRTVKLGPDSLLSPPPAKELQAPPAGELVYALDVEVCACEPPPCFEGGLFDCFASAGAGRLTNETTRESADSKRHGPPAGRGQG